MADLTGGPNGPSLGYGIGLAAPIDYSGVNQVARDYMHMSEARRQREVAAKKKADDDLRDLGIKAPVVHPLFQAETNDAVSGLGRSLHGLTSANDPDAYYKGRDEATKTQFILNKNIERSKYVSGIEQQMAADKAAGIMSDEARTAFEAMRKGDAEALKKIDDPEDRFRYDAATGTPYYRTAPNINTQAVEKSLIKDPNYMATIGSFVNKTYHNPKGGQETVRFDRIPETREEAAAMSEQFGVPVQVNLEDARDLLLQNSDYVDRKTSEFIKSGKLPKNFKYLPPEEQQARVSDQVYKNLVAQNGTKITRNIQNPNAPQQGALTEIDYNTGAGNIQEYELKNESGSLGKIKAEGVYTFTPVPVKVDKSTGVVDNSTMRKTQEKGVIKGTTGEVRILPTLNGDNPIRVEEYDKLIKAGRVKDIIYKPFATIKSDEKKTILNEKAYNAAVDEYNSTDEQDRGPEPVKSNFEREATDVNDYAKPLQDLAGSFGKKLDINKIENAAKERTDALHSEFVGKKKSNVESSNLIARKTKSGKVALFDANKKFVKWQ